MAIDEENINGKYGSLLENVPFAKKSLDTHVRSLTHNVRRLITSDTHYPSFQMSTTITDLFN